MYLNYKLFFVINFDRKELESERKDSWQRHRHDCEWLSCEVNCSAHAMPR